MEATEQLRAKILSRWDAAGVAALPSTVAYIHNVVTGKCE